MNVNFTRNFNLKLENNNAGHFISSFIENEYKLILDEEVRINRNPRKQDSRIHVAIYFIRPTSKGLSELDIDVLKKISSKVNVLPVLAKSDTLTEDELKLNKELIMKHVKLHNINIYNFEEEEEFQSIQDKLPFSIISSNVVQDGIHVRNYPWGRLVIEESNCDFNLLKNILFGSHLQEFKDQTINTKYENYRWEQLSKKLAS